MYALVASVLTQFRATSNQNQKQLEYLIESEIVESTNFSNMTCLLKKSHSVAIILNSNDVDVKEFVDEVNQITESADRTAIVQLSDFQKGN